MTDTDIIVHNDKERSNIVLDNNQILSYLAFLEKFYEKSQDKYHQERLFRINKAINSIKKYSKCKVSSFNFKSTKPPHNNNQKLNMPKTNVEQCAPFDFIGGENSVEDILFLIGKELKLNGINEKDINNSLLSTSKKSLNSSENLEIYDNFEKKSSPSTATNVTNRTDKSNTEEILPKTNINSKRLSKLFLKIELKLKTFLQENNIKNDIISDEKENDENNENENDGNANKLFSFEGKLTKSPSKLPNIINSFFSDKNKVNSILQKVQKQRRKSVMDFNTKFCHLSKDEKETETEYVNDSGDKDQNGKKRKKIMPCSAQVVIRQKITKNPTSEKVSNFYDMIEEKEEDREDLEDINAFDKIIEDEKNDKKENNNDIISNETISGICIHNDPSIKIASSLNNRNKFHFTSQINNSNNEKENIIKINSSSCGNNNDINNDNNNYFYVSKNSVFNEEKENEEEYDNSMKNNENDSSLLDDEILMKSSLIKEREKVKNNSKESAEKEESKDSEDSSKSVNSKTNSKDSINDDNEYDKYNMLKYINDSENRMDDVENDDDEEKKEKNVYIFDQNNLNEKKMKENVKRDIARANNIKGFYLNSILSPLKDFDGDGKENGQKCAIEEFTKFNS